FDSAEIPQTLGALMWTQDTVEPLSLCSAAGTVSFTLSAPWRSAHAYTLENPRITLSLAHGAATSLTLDAAQDAQG
ncbi:MAG: hypothetical protein RR482_03615, partial [Clostridia bacterium]